MTLRRLLFAFLFLTTPALADTVTLQIENDAGMVTTREGYTQTECDAAALLLNGSKVADQTGFIINGSGYMACPFVGGCQSAPQPHTSKLTKAQCLRPTAKEAKP
jgi:hypothetical protein